MHLKSVLPMLLVLCFSAGVAADRVNVAVASNFAETLRQIGDRFQIATGHTLRISPASTGKLYAQIRHGAPFDLFLAADAERPARLVRENRAVADTLFTYARGQLVLFSLSPGFDGCGRERLEKGDFRRLAIANPRTAPYGSAAVELLQKLGIRDRFPDRLIRGENVGQAFQFVVSGAADLGLVSAAQALPMQARASCLWPVPERLHTPIRQQAVLLERGRGNAAARQFLEFLKSGDTAAILRRSGYLTETVSE